MRPWLIISLEEFTPLAKFLSISDLSDYTQQITQQKIINKSHKGHVAIIGGDIGMCGAAIMAATAAHSPLVLEKLVCSHILNICALLLYQYPRNYLLWH